MVVDKVKTDFKNYLIINRTSWNVCSVTNWNMQTIEEIVVLESVITSAKPNASKPVNARGGRYGRAHAKVVYVSKMGPLIICMHEINVRNTLITVTNQLMLLRWFAYRKVLAVAVMFIEQTGSKTLWTKIMK